MTQNVVLGDSIDRASVLAAARLQFPSPAGRFILEHGRWFTPAPRPSAVRRGQAGSCYRNAARYVLAHPECHYAEGFAARADLPLMVVQHGWAVDPDDRVIDRTWQAPEHCLYFGLAIGPKTMAGVFVNQPDGWTLFHDGMVPDLVRASFAEPRS